MELQDIILKSFAETVNQNSGMSPESRTLYGTVTEITDDIVYVKFDGADADTTTPTKSLVQVGVGDVVMISMKDHSATIIGNISYPAITRAGDIYITTTTEGLIIGKLNADNVPTGNHILISNNDVQLRNVNGVKLASFGSTAQIGLANANHAIVDSNGLSVYNNNTLLARFGSTVQIGLANANHAIVDSDGLSVYNNNTLLARFGSTVQIGASNVPHTVLNSNGMIVYDASGNEIFRAGNGNNEFVGYTGAQTTGSMFAREGSIMAYKASGSASVTVGRGDISGSFDGSRPSPLQNISLYATAAHVGLYEDQVGWLFKYAYSSKQTFMRTLYGEFATDTFLRGPVTTLWSGTLNPTAGSTTTMATRAVSNLHKWGAVRVRVKCGNTFTHLVYAWPDSGLLCRVHDGSNTAEVVVDFNNNYVGIRRVSGSDSAALYAITSVIGLIRHDGY